MQTLGLFQKLKKKFIQRNNNENEIKNTDTDKIFKILVSLCIFKSPTIVKDVPIDKYFIIDKMNIEEKNISFNTDKKMFVFKKNINGKIICCGTIYTNKVIYNIIGKKDGMDAHAIVSYDTNDKGLTIVEIAEKYFDNDYIFNILNSTAYRMTEDNIIYKSHHGDYRYIIPQVYPYYPLSLNQFIRSICEYIQR